MIQKITEDNIKEFLKQVTDLPCFSDENVKQNINIILNILFEELYQDNPKSIIDFIDNSIDKTTYFENTNLNETSKINKTNEFFINHYLSRYGIEINDLSNLNNNSKIKLIYLINELFRTKGTKKTLLLFAEMLEDFIGSCNIYNITVEKTDSKYKDPEELTVINNNFVNAIGETININDCIISELHYLIDPSSYYYNIIDYYDGDIRSPKTIILNSEIIKLEYMLDDLHISDKTKLLTSVGLNEIKHPKFIMQLEQFISNNTNKKLDFASNNENGMVYSNLDKFNVFPIKTNLIYMQYFDKDSFFSEDTKMLNELVYRKANLSMAIEDSDIFKLKLDSSIYDIPLGNLYHLLSFIKLKEFYKNDTLKDIKVDSIFKNINQVYYDNSKFTKEELKNEYDEIVKLSEDYKNIDKDNFSTFKKNYFKRLDFNSIKASSTNDILDREKAYANCINIFSLSKLLKNTEIDSLSTLIELIKVDFTIFSTPDFYKTVLDIIDTFNIKTIQRLYLKLEELFFNEYENLIANIGDAKYVRLINTIELILEEDISLDPNAAKYYDQFSKLYNEIHKQIISQLTQKDINEKEFLFNSLFINYLISDEYYKFYINPIMDIFKKYFFNAELIIKENSFNSLIIKDKLQNIYLTDNFNLRTDIEEVNTKHIKDAYRITIKDSNSAEGDWVINNKPTNEITYDEEYKNNLGAPIIAYVSITGPDEIYEEISFF